MNQNVLFFIFLSVLAGLNLGTVRKVEDPIRDTQTNPILYEQKKEEEKDGKKGPLLYHVRNYPKETFFIDPPFEAEGEGLAPQVATGEMSVPSDGTDWWDELPQDFQEAVPETKVAEPSSETADAGDVPAGTGDDYWW